MNRRELSITPKESTTEAAVTPVAAAFLYRRLAHLSGSGPNFAS